MSISARYSPEHSGLDGVIYAFDFSPLLAPGVSIRWPGWDPSQTGQGGLGYQLPTPRLEIYLNEPGNMIPAAEDWYVAPQLAAPTPGQEWQWQMDEATNLANWVPVPPNTPLPTAIGKAALSLGTAVRGRQVYSFVAGGDPGVDYLFVWTITDSFGNRWSRSLPVLCGPTS